MVVNGDTSVRSSASMTEQGPSSWKDNTTDSGNGTESQDDTLIPQVLRAEDLENQPENEGEEPSIGEYDLNEKVSRTLSRKVTNTDSLIQKANETTEPLPKMGGGRDYPPPMPDRDQYVVTFDGPDDPTHPYNWPVWRKVAICAVLGVNALSLTLGSAMYSTGSFEVMALFNVGFTVATLGTSLFVFGFASGPVIFGPLSELYGRKKPLIVSSLGYVCFTFGAATAKDYQTLMLCRFFSGFVGAASLVVAPAAMADMFSAKSRGNAMTIFADVVFGGPMLAPIIGGFTVKNLALGWRWTQYFTGIVGSFSLIIVIFFYEETAHNELLRLKAETLRRRTGNWGIQSASENISLSLKEICVNNILRPIKMLLVEPILFLITLYNAFIYGLLYLFLTAIPLIFQGEYRWSSGVAELPYISMFIGILVGSLLCLAFSNRYLKAMIKNNGKPVPEERLPPMVVGGVFFAGGIFWLGWGGDFPERIHWMVPTVGAAFIGIGLILIFLPCMNYIIDCYLFLAASALAGNTLLRSIFGGVFPLFARQMFVNMHIKWAATLLGCVSVVLIPVPVLFYIYGRKIRDKSRYAIVLD